MSSSISSSELVQQAKESLDELNPSSFATALTRLVDAEPVRWRQILLLAGIWPEPSPQKGNSLLSREMLSCFLETISILLKSDDHIKTGAEIIKTLKGIVVLQAYYGDIVDELNQLAFVSSPTEVQIHRLVALAESQFRIIGIKVNQIHEAAGVVDPMVGYASDSSTRVGDANISLNQAFEALCENIELGLRFILHTKELPALPVFQSTSTPYKDADLKKFLTLSGIWRVVAEQWANMRYRDWRWTTINACAACLPADSNSYIREAAGDLRYQLFLHDRIMERVASQHNMTAYADSRRSVVASITVPTTGESWDGQVDLDALKQAVSLAPMQYVVEEYVDCRHYLPLIDAVKIGSIGWREWVVGKTLLYCLADAIGDAVAIQVADDDLACLRQVAVVRESSILNILVKCTGLSEQQSQEVLDVLRFDAKRRSMDIWDQPLIPCGEGLLFLVPAFVNTGNPARALENFVTQWGGASFDVRGIPFEHSVVRNLRERSNAKVEGGIKIPRESESELELDVVAWWEGYLLLLEAKCEKAVFSAADYHRAKRQIEKSIDQLILRRQALPSIWNSLRQKYPSLDLPEQYVGDRQVICVSVTNIMNFTGYVRDGIVVTDDSCFFRFFGDRMVKKVILGTTEGEDVEPIRNSELPHPSELIPYLLNPPQMRRFIEKMKARLRSIPAIKTNSSGFLTAHIEFQQ